MVEKKSEKIEREYVIPLREKCRPVPRYKKTPKAVKTIKEFLVRHMKIYDRDLNKIKIDRFLNEELWKRGIRKPLHKVKVKVVKEGEIVRVYAVDLSPKINFRKLREERIESKAKEALEKKKSLVDKAKESVKPTKSEEDSKEKPSSEEENLEKEIPKKEEKSLENLKEKPKKQEKVKKSVKKKISSK
jgi:large subunit ribosomal protein L31e